MYTKGWPRIDPTCALPDIPWGPIRGLPHPPLTLLPAPRRATIDLHCLLHSGDAQATDVTSASSPTNPNSRLPARVNGCFAFLSPPRLGRRLHTRRNLAWLLNRQRLNRQRSRCRSRPGVHEGFHVTRRDEPPLTRPTPTKLPLFQPVIDRAAGCPTLFRYLVWRQIICHPRNPPSATTSHNFIYTA